MPKRFLDASIQPAFARWLDASVEAASATLEFREIRKGVQALKGARSSSARGRRALEGAGKRAALSTFFAPLELLAVHFAAREMLGAGPRPRRIVDHACGFGAASAGASVAFEPLPRVAAVETLAAAADEARRTWSAFGVEGSLTRAAPRGVGRGDLVCLAWRPGSPHGEDASRLLERIRAAVHRGAGLLVVEPDDFSDAARRARWSARLEPLGVRAARLRPSIERPAFVRRMDKAARLDHQCLGMHLLVRPVSS